MSGLNLFDLSGKVAIVTGGATGLGRQMAEALAEAGAAVVICGRRVKLCEQAAREISDRYGPETLGVRCDISQEDEVDRLVSQSIDKLGKIDILVNNAGIAFGAPAEKWPLEKWRELIDVNLTGNFLCTQRVGRAMIKAQYGKIINISSVNGFGGTRTLNSIAYTAAKGAIHAMTKELATKWARHNIYVNTIAPGFFPSDMSGPVIDHWGEKLIEEIPLKRLGSEVDLKGPVVFLASPASDYVTGHILPVDGGQLAW